jgi:hypothetical protein
MASGVDGAGDCTTGDFMRTAACGPCQLTILIAAFLIAAGSSPAAAETDCRSSFLGVCTSRFTPAEQAEINARKELEALLRDPTRAGPELERRLRKQVRYSNGLLLIEDPIFS